MTSVIDGNQTPDHAPNIAVSVGYALHLVALHMKQALQEEIRLAGLEATPEQFNILRRLWAEDGLHQNALAELTRKDRHNIHRIASKLEEGGLIRREPDPGDKRITRCFLTPRGRELRGLLPPLEQKVRSAAFAGFSPAEKQGFTGQLARIMRNLGIE